MLKSIHNKNHLHMFSISTIKYHSFVSAHQPFLSHTKRIYTYTYFVATVVFSKTQPFLNYGFHLYNQYSVVTMNLKELHSTNSVSYSYNSIKLPTVPIALSCIAMSFNLVISISNLLFNNNKKQKKTDSNGL